MPPLKEDRYKTIIAMIMALLLFQILFFSSFWEQRSGSVIGVKRSTMEAPGLGSILVND